MTQILLISPSEMLAEQMKTIAEERGIGIETCTAILEEAESIAIDAIKRGIKVIISRSGIGLFIKTEMPYSRCRYKADQWQLYQCV